MIAMAGMTNVDDNTMTNKIMVHCKWNLVTQISKLQVIQVILFLTRNLTRARAPARAHTHTPLNIKLVMVPLNLAHQFMNIIIQWLVISVNLIRRCKTAKKGLTLTNLTLIT